MSSEFEVVDLSTPFHVGMPKYAAPWFPQFGVSEVAPADMPEASWKRRFTRLDLFAHNGTHVETSDHAFRDGNTVCKYDLSRFCGRPHVIDLSDVPDGAAIGAERIAPLLHQLRPERHAILLLRTGYNDRAWGSEKFWQQSPYLTADAAKAIAEAGAGFVGLDFQTEKPGEREFVVHKALLSAGVILCEYMFRLGQVAPDALFFAMPISIRDVEAAPVRAVALNRRGAGGGAR
jgi:kynurenine formamidase